MLEILSKLLCVKSIVTIILTIVFAVMCVNGSMTEYFMTIYVMIVAFYFGQQSFEGVITEETSTETEDDAE